MEASGCPAAIFVRGISEAFYIGHTTSAPPSLVVIKDKLHCFFRHDGETHGVRLAGKVRRSTPEHLFYPGDQQATGRHLRPSPLIGKRSRGPDGHSRFSAKASIIESAGLDHMGNRRASLCHELHREIASSNQARHERVRLVLVN